jgi:DNA-binding response OmpR family regulator
MAATVLVVEDDEAYGFAVSRFLQSKGYRTIVADSSMAALQILDDSKIDIIVVDVFLKKGEPHGFALSRMLNQRDQKPAVIIMTAHPEQIDEEPEPLFVKDRGLDELLRLVDAAAKPS